MATNFETRQNDVVEANPGDWWRTGWDAATEIFYTVRSDFKNLLKRWRDVINSSWLLPNFDLKNAINKKNQEKAKTKFEKRITDDIDLKKWYDKNKNEKANNPKFQKYTEKIMDFFVQNLSFLQNNYDNKDYRISYIDKGVTPASMKIESDSYEISKNMIKMKSDPNIPGDEDIIIENPTIEWLFIAIYACTLEMQAKRDTIDKLRKEKLSRIAWQQIAQNNEAAHKLEVEQANADLEAQLWNLA